MPTTWYFDGSGTDECSRVVVLTGVAAADEVWKEFDRHWADTCNELGLKSWHTTDQVRRLRAECPKTSAADGPQCAIPTPLLNAAVHVSDKEFQIASFAIDKTAARQLRTRHGNEMPDPSQLCVRLCFKALGVSKADLWRGSALRVFFDRNEPFIRWLKKPWQEHVRGARLARRGWPFQIAHIEPAAAIDHPGLQLADLISWAVRVRYDIGDRFADADAAVIFVGLVLTGKFLGEFLDYKGLYSLCIKKESPDLRHAYRFS
jgi:hypothetical protein